MKKNIVFLRSNIRDHFFPYISMVDKYNYYSVKTDSVFFKVLNKLGLNNLIFSEWKTKINDYNIFILNENNYSKKISKLIKRKNKNARVIMFYFNTMNSVYEKILSDKNIDEFWTFDKNDAKEYNMRYNSQFYSDEITLPGGVIKNDVLYLGRNKGRKNDLINIETICEQHNLVTNFKIIQSENDYISYDEYLKMISETKCILDYNKNNQIGLSLRPLEALFFEKKLITNNYDIVNYDFYEPQNIFIIGKDDFKNICKFIKSPYKKINKKIINYYDYKEWLKRFDVK